MASYTNRERGRKGLRLGVVARVGPFDRARRPHFESAAALRFGSGVAKGQREPRWYIDFFALVDNGHGYFLVKRVNNSVAPASNNADTLAVTIHR